MCNCPHAELALLTLTVQHSQIAEVGDLEIQVYHYLGTVRFNDSRVIQPL